MQKVISKIIEFSKKDISLFLYANALYSLSTGLISLLSPVILPVRAYEEFIYLFQIILFLTGVCTGGLVPALLRFHKLDTLKYKYYYTLITGLIYAVLIVLGFFPHNPISRLLNIEVESIGENLTIYGSIIFSLLYIFNRGVLTAESSFRKLTVNIAIILVFRLAALFVVYFLGITSIPSILFLICILPFSYEAVFFIKSSISLKTFRLSHGFYEFLFFTLKICAIGIIFLATSRLFVISAKGYDNSLAAALSFATGLTGIIHILNTTFNSYFIGKLDSRNPVSVRNYISRIIKKLPLFLIAAAVLSAGFYAFVMLIYPDNTQEAALISAITIAQSAIILYLGMITLLTKTFNLLNIQLALNVLAFILVFTVVNVFSKSIGSITTYVIINSIILLCELILAVIVICNIKDPANETSCLD